MSPINDQGTSWLQHCITRHPLTVSGNRAVNRQSIQGAPGLAYDIRLARCFPTSHTSVRKANGLRKVPLVAVKFASMARCSARFRLIWQLLGRLAMSQRNNFVPSGVQTLVHSLRNRPIIGSTLTHSLQYHVQSQLPRSMSKSNSQLDYSPLDAKTKPCDSNRQRRCLFICSMLTNRQLQWVLCEQALETRFEIHHQNIPKQSRGMQERREKQITTYSSHAQHMRATMWHPPRHDF